MQVSTQGFCSVEARPHQQSRAAGPCSAPQMALDARLFDADAVSANCMLWRLTPYMQTAVHLWPVMQRAASKLVGVVVKPGSHQQADFRRGAGMKALL